VKCQVSEQCISNDMAVDVLYPFKDEAQTVLSKDPVHTAQ